MASITENNNMELLRRQIISASPYVETASGPFITINATEPKLKKLQITFSPFQTGTGLPSPDNIRPIIGFSSITVTGCRKNLYDINTYPLTNNTWISGANGGENTSTTQAYASTLGFVPCGHLAGKILTLNKRPTGTNPGIAFYSSNNSSSFISGIKNSGGTAGTKMSFCVPLEAKYLRFTTQYNNTEAQIELGTETTSYEQYNGKSFTINLGNTYYGGYIDLVNGTFVQENGYATINGGVGTFYTQSDRIRFAVTEARLPGMDYGSDKRSGIMASNMPVVANGASSSTTTLPSISMGASSASAYIALPLSYNVTNTDTAITWLSNNPISCVYKLQTPNVIQLSPQVLLALRGVQTFFTENDYINIQYWTHVSENNSHNYGGLPILIDNARLKYSNGTIFNITADNDFFITGVFDSGNSDSKSYTMSRTTTSSSGTNSCARFFDNINGTSVDYWANNSANIANNPLRTFSSKGRYIVNSFRKTEAKNMYLYRTIDGLKEYLYKGINVI